MNAEIFAEWLRRQGHTIYRTDSSYWYDQGPRVVQAFPYHWIITPSDAELTTFMKQRGIIGLRYSTPYDALQGQVSYHAVYEAESYDLDRLTKWGRKNVRQGLKNAAVAPISFEQLARDGLNLQVDTLNRQGRNLKVTQETWEKRCLAAADLPGFQAWGALVDGRLAASVITFLMDDCVYMLYQQSHRDFLKAHVNNALGFVVTQTILSRPEVKSILYGLHSLDAPPSVDEFKFRLGYTAKPIRQRVVFHPWAVPFVGNWTHAVVRRAQRMLPGSPTLAKIEGMIRFYRQGLLPADQQTIPDILKEAAAQD